MSRVSTKSMPPPSARRWGIRSLAKSWFVHVLSRPRSFRKTGLDDETRFYIRPQKRKQKTGERFAARKRKVSRLRVAEKIHGVNEFPIRFPGTKIILPRQPGRAFLDGAGN